MGACRARLIDRLSVTAHWPDTEPWHERILSHLIDRYLSSSMEEAQRGVELMAFFFDGAHMYHLLPL